MQRISEMQIYEINKVESSQMNWWLCMSTEKVQDKLIIMGDLIGKKSLCTTIDITTFWN